MEEDLLPNWQSVSLEGATEAIIDYRGKSPRKTMSGIPLITARIVKDGALRQPEEFISPDDYESWMRRGLPRLDDVLITTEAPLGEVAQITNPKVALAQRLILLRGRTGVLNNTFLRYALRSPEVQAQLRARSTGTTVLGIRQSELRKIGLLLPPIDEQGRIAALLRSLDDKIELNQRMNETLEAIARAIFRFRLEDEVPNHTVQITDLVQCVRQSIEPQAHPNEIFDLYSIPAFDHERMPEQVLGLCIKSNKVLVVKGSVLLSKLNPRFPRVWLPTPRTERRAIASGEFLQMLPKPPATREFLYFLFDSEDFQQRFASLVTGTSGSHQRVRPEAFLSLRVGIAAPKSVERFSTVVAPLLQRVVANRSESATLATLRDSLLPKLITGEIRVGSLET